MTKNNDEVWKSDLVKEGQHGEGGYGEEPRHHQALVQQAAAGSEGQWQDGGNGRHQDRLLVNL